MRLLYTQRHLLPAKITYTLELADRGVLHLQPEQPREVKAFNPEDLDQKFAHVVDPSIPGTLLYIPTQDIASLHQNS
jgi:hypothetical protein